MNRLSTDQFLQRERARGKAVSPIFTVFGTSGLIVSVCLFFRLFLFVFSQVVFFLFHLGLFTYLFKVDWLHASDKGVAADFLGNLFVLLLKKMPRGTRKFKCQKLFELMQEFYEDHDIEDLVLK